MLVQNHKRAHYIALLTATLLTLWLGLALAQPSGWNQHEFGGIALSVPPGSEMLDQESHGIVLGHPDWIEFLTDYTSDTPAGALIEIRTLTRRDATRYTAGDAVASEGTERIAGIAFDVYSVIQVLPIDGVETEAYGRLLITNTPLPGGRYLLLSMVFADGSDTDAQQHFDEVLSTLEVLEPALTRDEIPTTVGLDSMLTVQIQPPMYRNWDRPDFFRIQDDDRPQSHLSVRTGDRSHPGTDSAVERMEKLVRDITDEYDVYEISFAGEVGIAVEWTSMSGDLQSRSIVLERCLPGEQIVLIESALSDDWLAEHGADGPPFDTFTLTLPPDAAPCPTALFADLRTLVDDPSSPQ